MKNNINNTLDKILQLISEVDQVRNSKGVEFRGKKYSMVVDRVITFRKAFGWDYGIETEVVTELSGDNMVAVKCVIKNTEGRVIGSGLAYEHKDNGPVNKLSALENCETSAIGRALASMGLAGGEYASANELEAVPRKTNELLQHLTTENAELKAESNADNSGFNPKVQKANDFWREVHMKCLSANMKTSSDFNALVSPEYFADRMREIKEHAPEVFNKIEEELAQAARRLKVEW